MEDGLRSFGLGEQQPLRYKNHNKPTAAYLERRAEFGLASNQAMPSSRPPAALLHGINRLLVLQVVIDMALTFPNDDFGKEKIFFSSLDSVNSIADGILRKLRGLLMVASLDSTNLELLEEESQSNVANKSNEKQAATQRKKKGKNRSAKKFNLASSNCNNNSLLDNTVEVPLCFCCL